MEDNKNIDTETWKLTNMKPNQLGIVDKTGKGKVYFNKKNQHYYVFIDGNMWKSYSIEQYSQL